MPGPPSPLPEPTLFLLLHLSSSSDRFNIFQGCTTSCTVKFHEWEQQRNKLEVNRECINITVFCDICPEDGGSRFLRNVSNDLNRLHSVTLEKAGSK